MKLSMFKGKDDLYALTEESDGTNLPEAHGPWSHLKEVELERDSGPYVALDPAIALDAIDSQGYYLSNVEITFEEERV